LIVILEGGMNTHDKDNTVKEVSRFCLELTSRANLKEKTERVLTRPILPAVILALSDARVDPGRYWDATLI
jgi:hypothetical protein